LFAAKLRIEARLRNGTDIYQALDAVRLQQADKFVDRPRRMSNGKDCHAGFLVVVLV
jgi:hypothetical protein